MLVIFDKKIRQSGVKEYLENGTKNDRNIKDERVELYGNLDVLNETIKIAQSKNYKETYRNIVLTFEEDLDPTTLQNVAQDFIKKYMAGYSEDEFVAYAEAHIPKQKLNSKGEKRKTHVHISIAKYSPKLDKYLDLGQHKQRLYEIEAIKNLLEAKYNLQSLDRNKIIQSDISQNITNPKFANRKDFIENINATIIQAIKNNKINNPKELQNFIQNIFNVSIEKIGSIKAKTPYLTISHPDFTKNIKLKGALYTLDPKLFLNIKKEILLNNKTIPTPPKPKNNLQNLENILNQKQQKRITYLENRYKKAREWAIKKEQIILEAKERIKNAKMNLKINNYNPKFNPIDVKYSNNLTSLFTNMLKNSINETKMNFNNMCKTAVYAYLKAQKQREYKANYIQKQNNLIEKLENDLKHLQTSYSFVLPLREEKITKPKTKEVLNNLDKITKNINIDKIKRSFKMNLTFNKFNNKSYFPVKDWILAKIQTSSDLINLVKNYPYTNIIFKNNYRNVENAISINSIILDFDNDREDKITMEEVVNRLKNKGVKALIITTKSHNKEKHGIIAERFRVIVPIKNIADLTPFGEDKTEIHKIAMNRFCEVLKLNKFVDKATFDLARMYKQSPNDAKTTILNGKEIDYNVMLANANKINLANKQKIEEEFLRAKQEMVLLSNSNSSNKNSLTYPNTNKMLQIPFEKLLEEFDSCYFVKKEGKYKYYLDKQDMKKATYKYSIYKKDGQNEVVRDFKGEKTYSKLGYLRAKLGEQSIMKIARKLENIFKDDFVVTNRDLVQNAINKAKEKASDLKEFNELVKNELNVKFCRLDLRAKQIQVADVKLDVQTEIILNAINYNKYKNTPTPTPPKPNKEREDNLYYIEQNLDKLTEIHFTEFYTKTKIDLYENNDISKFTDLQIKTLKDIIANKIQIKNNAKKVEKEIKVEKENLIKEVKREEQEKKNIEDEEVGGGIGGFFD